MSLTKFVSMELDDEDKVDLGVPCEAVPEGRLVPEFPWGLRISLTEAECKRLKLNPSEIEVGDFLHFQAFARITSISCNSMVDPRTGETKDCCRVELQIEQMAAEDESHEIEDKDDEE